ncbi:zinc-dependent alcohol dehydrogenase [Caproiciproducens faecalis]|uniref:Alcohol dehydrogenase catalytic domain-containing protein n=1 Tax=Caproiciproducens faecalis TaxID=2820301 RepID=A0ABS7DM36_9FIRM|nr:alcohol dehydrogenase catalytic domain-containing protein [Caproiciproducens faecalis]MBW7572368.1 alcohol dehydrogenase catalytic domain-containing protein [Caproiciproducens faecalis]
MKVLSLPEAGKLIFEDLPKPELTAGSAIIKMEACGICGSDATAYRGVNPTVRYPIQGIGHEGVGTIVEIGENDKGLKVGDRVALEPYVPCNKCHMCAVGRFNNCADIRVCGVHKNGMMAEYFSHPIQLIYKLPDEMDFHRAACVEPLTIGLHAATRARVSKGEHVVVFGAGTIGLLASFACLSYGATPIIVDVLQSRLDFAKECGIPYAFNSSNGGVAEYLAEVTNGKLPEAMIECTGAAPVLAELHNYVCHGGRVAMVGWPKGPVSINTVRCMQKELDILPSRNSNAKFPESIELINSGKVPVEKIITKVVKLSEVEATIQDMIANPSNYLKVVADI